MKRFKASAVAAVLVLAVALQACTSTTVYKAAGTAITAVDLAMNGWGDWVRAGKATAAQEAEVKKAFLAYQEAINIAEKATLAYYSAQAKDPAQLRAIMNAIVQAAVSVITVVNSYRVGAPPIPVPTVQVFERELVAQFGGR